MQKKRPAAVMVIAILHFILGGLWLLCIGGGIAMKATGADQGFMQWAQNLQPKQAAGQGKQPLQPQELGQDAEKFLNQKIPNAELAGTVSNALNIGLALLMVLSGIGLLRMASWGRLLSILYALLNIVFQIASLLLYFTVVMPVMQEFFKEQTAKITDPVQKQAMELGGSVGVIAGGVRPLLYLVYPVIVLIIMLLPSVGRAFRGETSPDEMPPMMDQYEDEPEAN